MNKFSKRLIILAILLSSLLLVWFLTPLRELIDLEVFFENRNSLLKMVQQYYIAAVLVFIGVYIIFVALSIPGALILTMLGGFFFGPWLATIFINVGATLGAFLVFLVARYFLGDAIQHKYGEKLNRFNQEIEKNGPNYMLVLRLVPLFPFFLVNLFAGVTTIRPFTYFWTTALGIIPGSFAYAWLGYAGASLEQGAPWQLFVALGLLSLLSLIPVLLQKIRKKNKQEGTERN